MARFNIIDAKTGSVKYSGAPRYNGTYCKVSYLEFSEICSDSLISWNIGDYIVYPRTGLTYRLFDIPQPKKRSYRSEYGGAYVYSNVQFFADTKWLEIEPFRDIVPADNKIHFTTQSSWSVWTNVESLIARLNAVMQAAHPDEWEFRLVNASEDSELYKLLHNEYLDFTVSGESVLDGLGKIYDSFGNIGWIHSVEEGKNIITVGIPPIYQDIGDFTEVYRYGAGRGLTEIRKSVTNKNELKTRLYAYGSTRNMIPRYYNELTPAIKDADSVNIPNLMLPLSKWGMTNGKRDASKAFVERNVSKYGLRPDTVYFDGSDGNKDIYPSIEGTTIGDLYDAMAEGEAYRPDLAKHNRGIRLDAVESVRGIVDDGIESDSGAKYVDTILIPVAANSGDYKENFEISLFSGVQAPMSGKVTIPLSGITIIGTSESAPYYLSYRATITVAGRNYVTDIYNPELAASIKFSLEDVEVECSEGDEISATLSCVRDNSAPATHIEINQVTLAAGIASKKDNSIVITIPQIGFDISTRAALGSQGIATISMKDGMCGGRSFVVKSCVYFESTDSWELTLYRGRDESLGMLFPNTTYPISAGDHFVLLDIAMPDTYIGMAEQRLLTAANELLESISEQKPFYELSVDAKYMIENNLTLLEGRYMRLSDTDMISDVEYVLIDTVVINESESSIPTYRVTLREQKRVSYSNSQSSGDSLTSLASGGGLIESGLTPKQKKILSCFDIDDEGDIYTKLDENGRARGLYSYSFISSAGKSDTPGAGGGTVVGATVGGVDVELIDGVLKFDAYPTAASLGLGNIAFKNSLAIADVANLQSDLDNKQQAISVIATNLSSHIGDSTIHITSDERNAWNNKWDYNEATIKSVKVNSATKADSAEYALTLRYNNISNTNYGNYVAFQQLFEISDFPHLGWFNSIKMLHGNTRGYFTEIATSFTGEDGMWRRSLLNGKQVGWYKILDSGNYNSYSPKLDGTGANGTWGINISGNAASATKLQTARTIWGQSFDGTGNVSGALTGATTIEASTSIKIGNATISWDSKYGCLKVDKGLYSTEFISAGGKSETQGGAGSGTVTGIKIGDEDIITPINGILNIPPYPTTTSLGLKNLAFKDSLSVSEVVGLQSALSNKQDALGYTPYNAADIGSALVYGILTNNTSQGGASCYDANPGLHFYRYNGDDNTIGGDDGWILQWSWNQGSVGGQLYLDDNPSKTIGIRGRDRDGTFTSWSKIALTSDIPTNNNQLTNGAGYITSSGSCAYATSAGNADTLDGQHASYFAAASSLGNYLPLSGGTITSSSDVPVIINSIHGSGTIAINLQNNNVNKGRFLYTPANGTEIYDFPSDKGLFLKSGGIYYGSESGAQHTIYHSGNSNLSTVGWTCSHLKTTHIYIECNADGTTTGRNNEINNFSAPLYLQYATAQHIILCIGGGNVGIGTTSPSARLHVEGNILATGAVTAGQASDARLKSNIVTARNACGILRSLRGVEFDWNAIATENCKDLTGHDVGLIAQEVESLIPSAIGTIWGEYKRLDYTKITPYLVEGWKAHDEEIQRLKTKIKQLEERIYELGR